MPIFVRPRRLSTGSSATVPMRYVGFHCSAMQASSLVFLLALPPMTTIASIVGSRRGP
jgi:hypothetical protein